MDSISFNFNAGMDFNGFGMPQQSYMKADEGNTSSAFFFGDEGIDTSTGGSFSQYESNNPLFTGPQESSFGMQQNLTMDNTMATSSAWNPQQQLSPNTVAMNSFPPTPIQSFDSLYQPQYSTTLGKRPLQLDVQDFPQSKRHEAFSPFPTSSASVAGSSWALDTQQLTPSSTSEVGLSDEAADVCATWFNKYAVLPGDRHIESLSQLTGEPAHAIRHWFGQLMKQGMTGGLDSAYKSQTGFTQDAWQPEFTEQATTEETAPCSHDTSNDTTTSQPALRGGKKGCAPTDDPALLGRDPNKIYQCTRKCGKRYGRKCDWKRNEEEGYPSKSWICSLCTSLGVEKVKPCFRKYHFSQHFRNIHPGINVEDHEEASIVYSETDFPRKCGFCRHRFTSRQDRIDHIADHFKAGKCMLDWNDHDDDTDSFDNTDDDDDRPSGDDFDSNKPFSQPSSKNPYGGSGSGYYNNGGNGSDDQQPPRGGFFQFQLAQSCDNDSRGQSSGGGGDQHIELGFEYANKQQGLTTTDPGKQSSIYGSHDATEGCNSVLVARDAIARPLTDQKLLRSPAQDDLEDEAMRTERSLSLTRMLDSLLQTSSLVEDIELTRRLNVRNTDVSRNMSLLDEGGLHALSVLLACNSLGEYVSFSTAFINSITYRNSLIAKHLSQNDADAGQSLSTYKSLSEVLFGPRHSHIDSLTGEEASSTLCQPQSIPIPPPPPVPVDKDDPSDPCQHHPQGFTRNCDKNRHTSAQPRGPSDESEAKKTKMIQQNIGVLLKNNQVAAQLADVYAKISTMMDNGHWNDWELSQCANAPKETGALAQLLPMISGMLIKANALSAHIATQPVLLAPHTASDSASVSTQIVKELSVAVRSAQSTGVEKLTLGQLVENTVITSTSQSFLSVKLLGTGGFSTVDEVVHRDTNLRIGRKTLKNRELSALEELKQEVDVLQKLRHPHIIRFLGTYSKGDKVSILVSPVAETTLALWLDKFVFRKPADLTQTIVKMFGCLASSVRYLHEQRPIVKHCDIKPQNILVMQGDQDFPHVVLSDFGISSSDEVAEAHTKPLTRHYCAPEVPKGLSREQAADIWSLGCVFAEMAAVPFSENNSRWLNFRQDFSGRRGKHYWQDVSGLHEWLSGILDQATTLTEKTVVTAVRSMLDPEPAARPTAASLTMVFTPAPCCLNWPNDKTIFPGPQEELNAVEMLVRESGVDCCAQLHVHSGVNNNQESQLFTAVKSWLDECSHDHEACRQLASDSTSLPTRLVDICPDGDEDRSARVIDTAVLDTSSGQFEYVAISHVWSPTDLTLTTDRLQMMQSELPRETLSGALNNAISAVKSIGYRYIWVDSLCILQDSDEDKQRECATMASVYRNATVTVVLDQLQHTNVGQIGKDNHGVRFVHRDETSTSTIEIKRYQQPTIAASASLPVIDFLTPGFAWDTRAWGLQERLLSRRILHLGDEQMYWECNNLKASETFPRGLPPLVWEKVHTKSSAGSNTRPLRIHKTTSAATDEVPVRDARAASPRLIRNCQWVKKEGDGIGDSMEAAQMTLQLNRSSTLSSITTPAKRWSDLKPPRSRRHLRRIRRIESTVEDYPSKPGSTVETEHWNLNAYGIDACPILTPHVTPACPEEDKCVISDFSTVGKFMDKAGRSERPSKLPNSYSFDIAHSKMPKVEDVTDDEKMDCDGLMVDEDMRTDMDE